MIWFRMLVIMVMAMALHLTLGWAWTGVAGFVAGYWQGRRGWLLGGCGVGLSWAALVLWNGMQDGSALASMTQTLGAILGNLPAGLIVALTLLIGILLGAVSGVVGTLLKEMTS